MKAAFLVKNGPADKAFEIREVEQPSIKAHEVLIKAEGFGVNFADVMARLKLYPDCPPLPTVLGYDLVGHIEAIGPEVKGYAIGDRVAALTHFGAYAEYAATDQRAIYKIPAHWDLNTATALMTQYCTAYYAINELINVYPGDKVLIHAAAGGVGSALVQMALWKGCEVFGTVGSDEKVAALKAMGVHHPINYRKTPFDQAIRSQLNGGRLDVVFDAVGGKSVSKGMKLLGSGGRMICYGAADLTSSKSILGKAKALWDFGYYNPGKFLMNSKSIMGVNMLRLGEKRQHVVAKCLQGVIELVENGTIKPMQGEVYDFKDLATAHDRLERRQTMGKVAVKF